MIAFTWSGYGSNVLSTNGRGPTMLISPIRIFTSWGNSLIFVFLKNPPIGINRGSFLVVCKPPARLGLAFNMVANFQISKGFFYNQFFFGNKIRNVPQWVINLQQQEWEWEIILLMRLRQGWNRWGVLENVGTSCLIWKFENERIRQLFLIWVKRFPIAFLLKTAIANRRTLLHFRI